MNTFPELWKNAVRDLACDVCDNRLGVENCSYGEHYKPQGRCLEYWSKICEELKAVRSGKYCTTYGEVVVSDRGISDPPKLQLFLAHQSFSSRCQFEVEGII